MKWKAYKWVELLVVIAIITPLLSMMMPDFRAAENQTQNMVSLSGLNGHIKAWGPLFDYVEKSAT